MIKRKIIYPLLVVIFSIAVVGAAVFESVSMRDRRLQGNMSHAVISDMTSNQLHDAMMRIYSIGNVRRSTLHSHIADVVFEGEARFVLANAGVTEVGWWQNMFADTFRRITGSYPSQANEIMASRHTLELLGITNPYIGMEIILTYSLFNTGEISDTAFVLSGYYTDFIHLATQDKTPTIFSSHAFLEKASATVDRDFHSPERDMLFVVFTDTENISANVERLRQGLNLTENQVRLSPAFDENQDLGNARIFVFSLSMRALEIIIIAAAIVVLLVITIEIISAKKRRRIANNEK